MLPGVQRSTFGNTEHMVQAARTVDRCLAEAIESIDKHFGPGYARAHPELATGHIRAQITALDSDTRAEALYEIADALRAQ